MHSLRIDHLAALLEAAHKLVLNRFQLIQLHIEQDQPAAQSVATNAGSDSFGWANPDGSVAQRAPSMHRKAGSAIYADWCVAKRCCVIEIIGDTFAQCANPHKQRSGLLAYINDPF